MIDAHAHACGAYCDCNSIADQLEKIGAEAVVLCGGEPESRINYPHPLLSAVFWSERLGFRFNRFIKAAAAKKKLAESLDSQNATVSMLAKLLPGKVYPAYWANPAEKDCLQKLESFYAAHKFCMIKLHQCFTGFDIRSPQCEELICWAEQHNIPVFIHLLKAEQAYHFTQLANRHANAIFIVAHLLGFDIISRHLKSQNVYFDLSSPQLYSIFMLKRALKKYGPERLIFGSDTPYGINNHRAVLRRLRWLKVSKDDLALITDGNIRKLLGI